MKLKKNFLLLAKIYVFMEPFLFGSACQKLCTDVPYCAHRLFDVLRE